MAAIGLTVAATTSTRTFGHPQLVKNLSVVKSRTMITTGTLQQRVNEHFLQQRVNEHFLQQRVNEHFLQQRVNEHFLL